MVNSKTLQHGTKVFFKNLLVTIGQGLSLLPIAIVLGIIFAYYDIQVNSTLGFVLIFVAAGVGFTVSFWLRGWLNSYLFETQSLSMQYVPLRVGQSSTEPAEDQSERKVITPSEEFSQDQELHIVVVRHTVGLNLTKIKRGTIGVKY